MRESPLRRRLALLHALLAGEASATETAERALERLLAELRELREMRLDRIQVSALRTILDGMGVHVTDLRNVTPTMVKLLDELKMARATLASPVPIRLFCPLCHALHIDEGECATRPHKSHTCQACGCTWTPSLSNTVGVRFLPGTKNA